MNRPDENDELIRRYREASAQDERRPSAHVREAVRAHARIIAASKAAGPVPPPAPAANQSRWKLSLLASVALAGLTGLLVLQFDRGTPEEQQAASGQRSPSAGAAPPALDNAPVVMPASPSPAAPSTPRARSPADAVKPRGEVSARPVTPLAPATPPPAAAPDASARDHAREQAAPLPFPTAPAPARSITRLAPAPAADAAARSAAPAQRQEKAQAQESFVLQAPQAGLEPGSPAMAMAIALHEAARTGRITQLNSLLRQGAPINAPDSAGRTPLMLAVIHGQTAVVQRLLAAGANPALVDREGRNALQQAQGLGLNQIASLIAAAS